MLFTTSDSVFAFIMAVGIVAGIISGAIGWSKHRSIIAWFFVGLFFNLLGILIAAIMSPNAKKCPHCGELSPYGTFTCEYCGYEFIPSEIGNE